MPSDSVVPLTPRENDIVLALASDLGSGRYATREAAFIKLQDFGTRAFPLLRSLRDHADIQVRLRLDYLLTHPPRRQEMVLVPGGRVVVGTSNPYCDNPRREIRIKPFLMDRYEVTNYMYQAFVRATGHAPPPSWSGDRYAPGEENLPVTRVTFEDARAYAGWAGKRLPTADEWEYAARGPKGLLFPWGNEEQRGAANIDNRRTMSSMEVGSLALDVSAFGIRDLAGNVSEWVVLEGDEGDRPAVKGSAFNKAWRPPFTQLCYRAVLREDGRSTRDVGFRCVRDAPRSTKKADR